jgi:hypothetical protein
MRRRWSGIEIGGQGAMLAEARAGYLKLDWPEAVHVASKGYEGSGGTWRFVWRTSLELIAILTSLPGLKHWSARSVLYVGRSSGSLIAVRLRPRWIAGAGEVHEAWRTPLGTAEATGRTFGYYSLIAFDSHPVWVLTSEVGSLLGGRD